MQPIHFLEIIKSSILGVTETTNIDVQTIQYISNPFFSTLSIFVAIGTCIRALIYAYKPAFVNPVINVRISPDPDEVDLPIMLLFLNGFSLSLVLSFIPTLTTIHPIPGLMMLLMVYVGGCVIGMFSWLLFQAAFLQILPRCKGFSPRTTIRKLRCQECTKPLHLIASHNLSQDLLSDYLSPIEQVAATGETNFTIWYCSYCYPIANRDSVHIRGYRLSKAVVCLSCQETTLRATGSYKTWINEEEHEVTTHICKCCSAERSTTRFIQGGYDGDL